MELGGRERVGLIGELRWVILRGDGGGVGGGSIYTFKSEN
jgi:hypothetical protein